MPPDVRDYTSMATASSSRRVSTPPNDSHPSSSSSSPAPNLKIMPNTKTTREDLEFPSNAPPPPRTARGPRKAKNNSNNNNGGIVATRIAMMDGKKPPESATTTTTTTTSRTAATPAAPSAAAPAASSARPRDDSNRDDDDDDQSSRKAVKGFRGAFRNSHLAPLPNKTLDQHLHQLNESRLLEETEQRRRPGLEHIQSGSLRVFSSSGMMSSGLLSLEQGVVQRPGKKRAASVRTLFQNQQKQPPPPSSASFIPESKAAAPSASSSVASNSNNMNNSGHSIVVPKRGSFLRNRSTASFFAKGGNEGLIFDNSASALNASSSEFLDVRGPGGTANRGLRGSILSAFAPPPVIPNSGSIYADPPSPAPQPPPVPTVNLDGSLDGQQQQQPPATTATQRLRSHFMAAYAAQALQKQKEAGNNTTAGTTTSGSTSIAAPPILPFASGGSVSGYGAPLEDPSLALSVPGSNSSMVSLTRSVGTAGTSGGGGAATIATGASLSGVASVATAPAQSSVYSSSAMLSGSHSGGAASGSAFSSSGKRKIFDKYDAQGNCVRHKDVRLKEPNFLTWRTVLESCPKCEEHYERMQHLKHLREASRHNFINDTAALLPEDDSSSGASISGHSKSKRTSSMQSGILDYNNESVASGAAAGAPDEAGDRHGGLGHHRRGSKGKILGSGQPLGFGFMCSDVPCHPFFARWYRRTRDYIDEEIHNIDLTRSMQPKYRFQEQQALENIKLWADILQNHEEQTPLMLTKTLHNVKTLAKQSPAGRAAIEHLSISESIVEILSSYRFERELYGQGCLTIYRLCKDPVISLRFTKELLVSPLLVLGLHHYSENPEHEDPQTVSYILGALWAMTVDSQSRDIVEQTHGLVHAVVKALEKHHANIPVAEHACLLLKNIALGNDENRKLIIRTHGALPGIVMALQRSYHNIGVARAACRALWELAVVKENQGPIGLVHGIFPAMGRALTEHQHHADVAECAFGVLHTLAERQDNEALIASTHSVIAALSDILQEHNRNPEVALRGCWVIRNLSFSPKTALFLGETRGVIAALVSVLDKQMANAVIAISATTALANITQASVTSRVSVVLVKDSLDIIAETMMLNQRNFGVQWTCFILLSNIARSKKMGLPKLKRSNLIGTALVRALDSHTQQKELQECGEFLLGKLDKHFRRNSHGSNVSYESMFEDSFRNEIVII